MSHFSDVDASNSAASLIAYLEATDRSMSPLKAYVATVLNRGVVLDIGCGLGRDLVRLAAHSAFPIGLDRSATLLSRAQQAGAPLVQADALAIPLRDSAVDGVRIERTLQHVADPAAALDEVARVARPGGWVAVLEPDFSVFHVASDLVPRGTWPAALLTVRHPTIGAEVAEMLVARGFRIRDIVTESSRGYAFGALPVDGEVVVRRAVDDGRCDAWLAQSWLDEQRTKSIDGTFRARWDKILVVATKTS